MYFCCYCGKSFQDKLSFCPYCGKEQPQLNENQVYAPNFEPHTAYSFEAVPEMSRPAKLFGKLSFIAGLLSLIFGAVFILLFLILTLAEVELNSLSVSYEPFSIVLGVAAIVMSVLARKKGNYLRKPQLGRIFGIIGIILGVISMVLFLVFVSNSFDFSDLPDFSL